MTLRRGIILALGLAAGCNLDASEDTSPDSSATGQGKRIPRVLYVEHPPRYEYRFLKNALIRDPGVLAHCFLTSADKGFPQEHTRSDDPLFQRPLETFPATLEELNKFNVLIYGDVPPGLLGKEAVRNIDRFVREKGGGVIFISGKSHNPRMLPKTALAELLPVTVEGQLSESEVFERPYTVTEEGRRFLPFEFAGKGGPAGEVRRIVRLVKAKPKPGATVLVRAGPDPLFVTQKIGAGRVFWSASDETWLWRTMVGDSPYFYPFWRRAIDWAAGGR